MSLSAPRFRREITARYKKERLFMLTSAQLQTDLLAALEDIKKKNLSIADRSFYQRFISWAYSELNKKK